MAIYSWFTYKKLLFSFIFHSYVSLPEGNFMFNTLLNSQYVDPLVTPQTWPSPAGLRLFSSECSNPIASKQQVLTHNMGYPNFPKHVTLTRIPLNCLWLGIWFETNVQKDSSKFGSLDHRGANNLRLGWMWVNNNKPTIWESFIQPIYGDDWGMVSYRFTHIN